MIKINKRNCPQVLIDHQTDWTNDLLDAIQLYGGHDRILDGEKKNLLSYYRHKDIKTSLFASNHNKCAFCECKP